MIEGRLGYNSLNDRYGILVNNLWENDGFHCVESVEVLVDDKWIPSRSEISWTENKKYWYLVGITYCGDLEYVRVRQ